MLNKLAETVMLHVQSQLFQTLPHEFRLPQIFLPLKQTLRYYLNHSMTNCFQIHYSLNILPHDTLLVSQTLVPKAVI